MRYLALSLLSYSLSAQVINEYITNLSGADNYEFVEVFGPVNTDLSHLTILIVEGDVAEDPGLIKHVFSVGSTNSTGHYVTPFQMSVFDNDHTLSILLVDTFSGSQNDDIDANDDGTIDNVLWSVLTDSIGTTDNDIGDFNYGPGVVLAPNFDGVVFVPGGASRYPDGTNTGSISDWVRNDFDGAGLPGYAGSIAPNEAYNTPGDVNEIFVGPPGSGAKLSEFLLRHDGQDDFEFVEIHGDASTSYSDYAVVILEGDVGENPGQIDTVVNVGSTSSVGFWSSAFFVETFEDGAATLLLVSGFSGAVLDDLDSNDDGVLDVTPWSELADSLSVSASVDGGFLSYSSVDLGAVGGASRFPYYLDTDTASDWVLNDPGLLGLAGVVGVIDQNEAFNTPGLVNRVALPIYYGNVSANSQVNLRTSLHNAVQGHIKYPYSSSSTDSWDILEMADENPSDPTAIIDVYKNASYVKQGGGNSFYNREHTWPKTFGFPDDTASAYPYTDCHHLRLCDISYNSDRGSAPFNNCESCSERTTMSNNGTGGGSGTYPGNSNWFDGSLRDDNFETWGHRKGDVARSIFYMDIRYDGGNHPESGIAEPNLALTDNRALIVSSGSNTTGTAYMGFLSVLIEWHLADPVDDQERLRNEVVQVFQGNRNPFVDHPEWVECLYLGVCGDVLPPCTVALYGDWKVGPALDCQSGNLSILDYVGLVSGVCNCPAP